MSFSDMMQSGRGPGVIGMLMALVVLLGFGVLFMFAFDEGLQGADQSIESVIAHQGKEIEDAKLSIGHSKKLLDQAPALLAAEKELGSLKRENVFRQGKIEGLRKSIAEVKELITAKKGEIESYKDQYRVLVRGRAKGEQMAKLESRKGEVYEQVTIREVTPIGIQILHSGGQKRIPFEELSAELQDRFQFDPNQKAQAIAKENQMRNEHEAAVSVANASVEEQRAEQKQQEAAANREKAIRALAVKQSRVESLKREIDSLGEAIPKESLKSISRAPQMRLQLAAKQRDLAALEADIARISGGL